MVSMGNVWDRTVEVLRGRASILASIAGIGILLPSVLRDLIGLVAPTSSGLYALIGLLALVATVWAQLAMLAVATDPATDRAEASRLALSRLGVALGVVILLGLAFALLFIPAVIALAQSGVDYSTGAIDPTTIPAGLRSFLTIYFLLFFAAAFWLGARLLLLNAVILRERLGLGAIMRSVRLTRGATWRIIGVMLLFVILLLVCAGAVQVVIGLMLRLLLGAGSIATVAFLASLVASIVTTAFSVVAAAFTAQLYVAAREGQDGA
ncbi:hypothetical protein KCP91_14110 [Microvirga sp. SRT01]|uniref:Glycerophosphoryl diester phosphodiesterase membrane domain-containing protein n=1 Tax=Sphingomonas longa TaxID=2778730 RepID=A0ABS2D996_9SPHN|nr:MULTISPECIES: hypothetical protein [Alphaproteobacteria]MBM6577512.1 hypothetical protein [Sphingomonas sp. BT552]MBR7710557.1 hypothetical protein [Microvirga sp. SRT01]